MDASESEDVVDAATSIMKAAIAKLIGEGVSAADAKKRVEDKFCIINADNSQVLNIENLCKP